MITWVAYAVTPVNATTAGFAYLLFVFVVASTWGFVEAALSSVLSTLAFNFFFFEPRLTFTISDPANWVALFSFLVTALLASRLSTQARQRTLDAVERQLDLERLYAFGRSILLIDNAEPFAKQLANRLADALELSAVALYEPRTGEFYRAGPLDFEGMDSQLRETASLGTTYTDPERNRVITSVRLGSEPIASLGMQGRRMPDSVVQSVANLVAIGLERSRAQDLAHEMEASRRSERLRTTLVDAMAHELKTPLTSIRAATTALLARPDQRPPGETRMLTIADEEAAHLEELIDDALDIARLESDHLKINLEVLDILKVVSEVMESMKTAIGDRRVEVVVDDQLPAVAIDKGLMKLALKQIVDNALKYSPSGTPVTVHAFRSNGRVALEITDQGKGISKEEQARVFDRYYRGPLVRDKIPGSGLGLSIALRILQAHGGDISVKSRPGETRFRLAIPVTPKEERS
jgi:two-component system sensor histidine kinase KdpD